RSVPRITREYERFTFVREMKDRIVGHIQRCINAKSLPADVNPLIAFRLLTMGLLGVAVMRVSDRLAPGENADDLARDVINVVIAGLRSGASLHSTATACAEEERARVEVSRRNVTHEGVVR